MKKSIKKLLSKPFLARHVVRFALHLHNFSYRLSGEFSQALEKNKLHPKHRLTDYHNWFVGQIEKGWEILDVGCGNGALTADLAKHCRNVVGIDISQGNIEQARKRSNGKFICGDMTKYSFDRTFDAIVLSNVLEHIESRIDFLKNLRKLSKKFLIRVPMIDRDWITLYKREMGMEYRLDPQHFVEYTLEGFTKELNSAGLKIDTYRICFGEINAVASIKND